MSDPFRQSQIGSRPIQSLQTIRKTLEYFVSDDMIRELLGLTKSQVIVEVRRSVGKTRGGDDLGIGGCIVVVVDLG